MEPQYRRVLLKLSGEALAGAASRGLDFDVIGSVCDVIVAAGLFCRKIDGLFCRP